MLNIKMNESVIASTMKGFTSTGYKVGNIKHLFPKFTRVRVMMMPFYAQDLETIPESIAGYKNAIREMLKGTPEHCKFWDGNTAYLTIDEKELEHGQCQRKEGLHIDGMYRGQLAGAWGGSGGGWGSCGNGMLLASNTDDLCKMWLGDFDGVPINDGDCEHLRGQLASKDEFSFKEGDVVWADGMCVHQSFAPTKATKRQFIRISLPNNSPWFVGYTENPLGIKPSGEIINIRRI